MGDDARFFLTTAACTCTLALGITRYVGRGTLPSHVGVGLGGNSLPPRKDAHRREGFRRYGHWLMGVDPSPT